MLKPRYFQGAVTLVGVTLLLKTTPPLGYDRTDTRSSLQKTLDIDWIGAILIVGAVTCLAMGLQWGGNDRPWNDAGVIIVRHLRPFLSL